MLVSDLLQTIKHRLNRSAAFPLKAEDIQLLNACIDKLVSGGRIYEDEEMRQFLNPPVAEETEELTREDRLAALQALVDDAQAMGAYELTGNPLVNSPFTLTPVDEVAINTELTNLPEPPASIDQPIGFDPAQSLESVAPVEPASIGLPGDSVHTLIPVDTGDIGVAPVQADEVGPPGEISVGDIAVAEVTENTNDESGANVESEQS